MIKVLAGIVTLLFSVPLSSPASAAVECVVPNGVIFNIPAGAKGYLSQQYAFVRSVICALDNMPAGETARIGILSMDLAADPEGKKPYVGEKQDISRAIIRTVKRGAHVQVLFEKSKTTTPKVRALMKAVGSDKRAKSFVNYCDGSCMRAGGLGTHHTKYVLVPKFRQGSRWVYNTTWIGGANFTGSTGGGSFNEVRVIQNNKKIFDGLSRFHRLSLADRQQDGHQVIKSGVFTLYLWPRKNFAPDPHLHILNRTTCKAPRGYGVNGRTQVRAVMFYWSNSRAALANKLEVLRKQGCDVQVIVNNNPLARTLGSRVARALVGSGRVPTWNGYRPELENMYQHMKIPVMVNGMVSGKGQAIVISGSANNSQASIKSNDETSLRTDGRSTFQIFLTQFDKMRGYSKRINTTPVVAFKDRYQPYEDQQ